MPSQTRSDILPASQRALLPSLAPLIGLGFVLYSGTAVALRYGHRVSVDFDFFTDRPLDRDALVEALPWMAKAETIQSARDTLVVLTRHGRSRSTVKVSFFGGLSFGRVGRPEPTVDGFLRLASVRDLFATKLKALFDRVEPKDYVDIAEMLKNGAKLRQALSDASVLFGPMFAPAEALRILCWYGEPELASLLDVTRRLLTDAARTAWEKPLPPSRRLSSSLG